jgi:hypothetical protein
MNLAYRASSTDRRYGLLLTVLVHAALLAGWQAMRTLPVPAPVEDGLRTRVFWIPLALPEPRLREQKPAPLLPAASAPGAYRGPALVLPPVPAVAPASADSTATPPAARAPGADAPPVANETSARQIMERARRDIGGIDKALRKENRPYIAAPLDSPQIRLRQGMEQAHALAPNRLWEAPKVEELVNNTGDGARRSRVITGGGTYCITERAPTTSIDMIEKHGKLRFTTCPEHEEPAKQQAWRTLQD